MQQTTNTSSKPSHMHQSHAVKYEEDIPTNLASFSNSEPRLYEQFVHDANCVKNKNHTHSNAATSSTSKI